MRILIVEDDKKTSTYLQKGLKENGFTADIVTDGLDGWYYILNYEYDLILLDIMVPQLNGWELITRIRKVNQRLPILVLSARDTVQDRVNGINRGADDYLIKPFAFTELLARINALLRREVARVESFVYKVADLEVYLREHKVIRSGVSIRLTAKEFLLLVLLIRNRGELLSRTVITEKVWDINFDNNSNVVDVMIRRLRQKIDEPFETNLIHTVHGSGYVLDER